MIVAQIVASDLKNVKEFGLGEHDKKGQLRQKSSEDNSSLVGKHTQMSQHCEEN